MLTMNEDIFKNIVWAKQDISAAAWILSAGSLREKALTFPRGKLRPPAADEPLSLPQG